MSERHQGWRNYPTFAVYLWWSNESSSHENWLYTAREYVLECAEKQDAVTTLEDEMKGVVEECTPELNEFFADLLSYAIEQVDFREIATYYVDAVYDEVQAERMEQEESEESEESV